MATLPGSCFRTTSPHTSDWEMNFGVKPTPNHTPQQTQRRVTVAIQASLHRGPIPMPLKQLGSNLRESLNVRCESKQSSP